MEEYKIEEIRDTMDETAQVPESIYFFMVEKANNLLTLYNLLVWALSTENLVLFCFLT